MDVADLTVAFTENGHEKVRELDKVVLSSSSSWVTIAFLFAEIDADSGAAKAPKVSLRRYKKRAGRYVLDKHFVLSSGAQATTLGSALGRWFSGAAAGGHDVEDIDEE